MRVWVVGIIEGMLALSLLQYELLQVFIGEDAGILAYKAVDGLKLLVVATVFLVFERFLGWNFIVDNFSLLPLALGRASPLVYTGRHEGNLRLAWLAGEALILFTLAHHPRVVLHVVLLLLPPTLLLMALRLIVVVVVGRQLASSWNHHWRVLCLGCGVIHLHWKIIVFFVLC